MNSAPMKPINTMKRARPALFCRTPVVSITASIPKPRGALGCVARHGRYCTMLSPAAPFGDKVSQLARSHLRTPL